MEQGKSISRAHLLTADLGLKSVTSVEINQITMVPGQKGDLHLHPCPVTGYIVKGQAVMQIEGQEEVILNTGMVFYEPANVHIAQFSNYSNTEELIFVAFYLLNGRQELIKFL